MMRLAGAANRATTGMPEILMPRCWDCGTPFRVGDGYGEAQAFCSETCADTYRHELGA